MAQSPKKEAQRFKRLAREAAQQLQTSAQKMEAILKARKPTLPPTAQVQGLRPTRREALAFIVGAVSSGVVGHCTEVTGGRQLQRDAFELALFRYWKEQRTDPLDPRKALRAAEDLEAKAMDPQGIALAMNNQAASYYDAGEHEDACAVLSRVLRDTSSFKLTGGQESLVIVNFSQVAFYADFSSDRPRPNWLSKFPLKECLDRLCQKGQTADSSLIGWRQLHSKRPEQDLWVPPKQTFARILRTDNQVASNKAAFELMKDDSTQPDAYGPSIMAGWFGAAAGIRSSQQSKLHELLAKVEGAQGDAAAHMLPLKRLTSELVQGNAGDQVKLDFSHQAKSSSALRYLRAGIVDVRLMLRGNPHLEAAGRRYAAALLADYDFRKAEYADYESIIRRLAG